jgi:hypothetical protein
VSKDKQIEEKLRRLLVPEVIERYRVAVESFRSQQQANRELDRFLRLLDEYQQQVAQNLARDSGSIQASGVMAAQEAKADPSWFVNWTETKLPDILTQSTLKAQIQFNELQEKKENAWSNRIKRAFWYIVGIAVTAIVTYYLALAGFKI